MKLYQGAFGPNSRRIRIGIAETGAAVDPHVLDFAKGEMRAPDYLALNPMGKVPTLEDGGFVLWESAAILCYLAQTSGSPLWPASARDQGDLLRWLFFGACHLDGYYTTLVVERFVKGRQGQPEDADQTAAAEAYLARFIPIVEEQLASREYLTGTFGLADIALGCTLGISHLVKVDLAPYPYVRAWLERLQARESWRKAS